MLNYRHVPFSIFRKSFGGVGEAGLKTYDLINGQDGLSGLGVPAKSITIINHGPGIIYYQISSNGLDIGMVDGIDSGQGKGFSVEESVYTGVITLYSDNAATVFSLVAAPGIWTAEELSAVMSGV